MKRNTATLIQLKQIVTDYEATRKKQEAMKRQKKVALSGRDEVSYCSVSTEAAIQRATVAPEIARLKSLLGSVLQSEETKCPFI